MAIGGSVYDHGAGHKDHESGCCKDRAGDAALFAVPCIYGFLCLCGRHDREYPDLIYLMRMGVMPHFYRVCGVNLIFFESGVEAEEETQYNTYKGTKETEHS